MSAGIRRGWSSAIFVALAALGCGGGGEGIDRHVEDLVTIDQGIYGQITSADDVGDADHAYLAGFGVDVYTIPDGTVLGTPLANTVSGQERGYYELALDAGDWLVCTRFQRCVIVTVAAGQRLRLDYEFSNAPGWSRGTPWEPPQP
jgi:hypothetical protein